MSDLRERVAEAMWQADMIRAMGHPRSVPWAEAGPAAHRQWLSVADAAIALVLAEAARVAVDGPCGQPAYAWDYWCGYGNGKRAAAAAIRSLGGKDE